MFKSKVIRGFKIGFFARDSNSFVINTNIKRYNGLTFNKIALKIFIWFYNCLKSGSHSAE